MKRAGAARIYRKTRGMTFRQEVEFWRKESVAARLEWEAARLRKSGQLTKK